MCLLYMCVCLLSLWIDVRVCVRVCVCVCVCVCAYVFGVHMCLSTVSLD